MDKISFAATAPTHVSKVGIKAKDADALSKYYQDVVGLREISRKGQSVILGCGRDAAARYRAGLGCPRRRSAQCRPLSYRLSVAGPRRSCPLGQTGNRQAHADRRRLGSFGQRGDLSDRSRRQRYRDLCRSSARELEMERIIGGDGHRGARCRQSAWRSAAATSLGPPRQTARWLAICTCASAAPRKRRPGGKTNSGCRQLQGMAAAPYSCRPAAIITTSPPTPGRAAGAGRRDNDRSGLAWAEFSSADAKDEREIVDPWGNVIRIVPAKG